MNARILMGLVLTLALIGLACGGEGEKGTGATVTPVQQVETPAQPAAGEEVEATAVATPEGGEEAEEGGQETPLPTATAGSGIVTIGDATYEFDIDLCEISADGSEIDIRGQGTGPDGRPLTVRASRSGEIDIVQVRLSEGLTIFRAATGVSDVLGGEAPSFQVDGRTVTATATFYTTEEQERGPEAVGAEGSFVAVCP